MPAGSGRRASRWSDHYLLAEFRIPAAAFDLFSYALWEVGTLGFEYRESRDGHCIEIQACFVSGTQPGSVIERLLPWLKEFEDVGMSAESWRQLEAIDWNNVWRSTYGTIDVGRRLVVVPSWSRRPFPGREVVRIRPEMAFGTGHHETTRLCLEALEKDMASGEYVADIGTGSGILALAALRLGARRVDACDPDAIALRNARHNARLNRVADRLRIYEGDTHVLPSAPGYDRIVANLVLEPLRDDLCAMASRLKSGGAVLVSGLLAGQDRDLQSTIERAGLRIDQTEDLNDWLLLTLRHAGGDDRRSTA